MTGINKAPISLDLETDFIRPKAGLQPGRLGKGECVAVIIQNTLTNEDGTGNPIELMIGKGAGQIYNMLPGQESPVIYANDLEDIYVRIRVAVMAVNTVYYTVIVYKQKRPKA